MKGERPDGEGRQDAKLQPGQPAKYSGAEARADDVQSRDRGDGDEGSDFQGEWRPVKNVSSVSGEAGGECGRKAGIENEKAHPSVKECGTRPKAFVKVDVCAAGARKPAGEFAVAEGTAERHDADGEPDDEEPEWRAERFGHAGGSEKNSHSDGLAGGGTETELTSKTFGGRGVDWILTAHAKGRCVRNSFGRMPSRFRQIESVI